MCPVYTLKLKGVINLYTRKTRKTNELQKIKNILFSIEDFCFCFVYIGLGGVLIEDFML